MQACNESLERHAAALLRLSHACVEQDIAEEIRMTAYALMRLAEGKGAGGRSTQRE